jgi:hypothetical protein
LLVVLFHAFETWGERVDPAAPGVNWDNGAAGVDIFFIISGFVAPGLPRWLLTLGDASYSIYLSHGFVLPALGLLFSRFAWPGVWTEGLTIILCVSFGSVIGWRVFILIESPMLRALRRGPPLRRLDILKPIAIQETAQSGNFARRRANHRHTCPAPFAKIFRFTFGANHFYIVRIPAQHRGAFRDRHERRAGDAVDAAALLTRCAWLADGEVVWS